MDFSHIILFSALGIGTGALATAILFYFVRKQILSEAQDEARELLKETQEQFAAEEQERAERVQEIELEAWAEVEEAHLGMEQKCEELDTRVQDKKTLNEEKYKTLLWWHILSL